MFTEVGATGQSPLLVLYNGCYQNQGFESLSEITIMAQEPDIHRRRSLRLRGYDYTQDGAYFITICAHGKQSLFGEIVDGEMRLNEYGRVVLKEWLKTPVIRKEIRLDEYVVMPNHFHGIVFIQTDDVSRTGVWPYAPTPHGTLPSSIAAFVQGLKSTITRQINELRMTPGTPVWQRNYYEHVIRGEDDLNSIREYIQYNPLKWAEDGENPGNYGE